MTESALSDIEAKARNRWPLTGVCIIHRIGELLPTEQIVLVITASAHRQAAFDSANFIMDYLKTLAPFWKKEAFINEKSQWVDAKDADQHAFLRW
jgi:molybdopterin synthase catalytic subunit